MKQVRFGKLVDVPSKGYNRNFLPPLPPITPAAPVVDQRRGEYGGACQRTSCQAPNSAFCRHRDGFGRHYCVDCAQEINRVNRHEAVRLFGHPDIIEIPDNLLVNRVMEYI